MSTNTLTPTIFQRILVITMQMLNICKRDSNWLRKKISRSLVTVSLLPVLAAQAQVSIQTNQAGLNSKIEVLGDLYSLSKAVGEDQGRIVVYRTSATANLKGATSVFINGQYHTSLIPNGYSFLCLKPGEIQLGARQFEVGGTAKDRYDTLTVTGLEKGTTQFLTVAEDAGRPVLKPVSSAQALGELNDSRLQKHTVSRVWPVSECREAAAPAQLAKAPAKDEFVLMVDVLFEFARSDIDGITQQGQLAINEMISRIRLRFAQIDHVHLIGHTDPLGSVSFNEKLAVQRANTIRDYIEKRMRVAGRFSSEGRAARDLVETRCAKVATPTSIACNQPNRRVVAEVTGYYR